MAKVSQMQGVPAHLEYLKSDGKRRHPAHCKYADGKGRNRKCDCINSPYQNKACHSASKCSYYEDLRNFNNK